MRKFALFLALFGIFSLLLVMHLDKPIEISTLNELNSLLPNQKVLVEDIVARDSHFQDYRVLTLQSGIVLHCDCKNIQNLAGKNISALGVVDTFQKAKVKVLKIKW